MACFEDLASWENLRLAFFKARRGKRGHPNVAAFEDRWEEKVLALRHELLSETYRPGGYRSFFIHEPKRRRISAAPFRDRVVHHALCNLLQPLFEPAFSPDSYANRAGKGTHRALARCQQFARKFRFVLQLDIRQFFPSVDHQILLRRLALRVQDPKVLDLASKILGSGDGVLGAEYHLTYFPGDDLFAALRPRGLPIGNLTSQFWANVYLDSLDHFVKRSLRCPGYLRYVDDFLLFSNSKSQLWDWLHDTRHFLAGLRLRLHSGSHPKPVREGIPFLGFVTFPHHRKLRRRKGVHYRRRLRGLVREALATRNPSPAAASFRGWEAHCRYANTVGLRAAVREQSGLEGLEEALKL